MVRILLCRRSADIHLEPVGTIHGSHRVVEGLVKVAEIDFLAEQLPCRFFIYLDGNHAFGYILQAVNSQFRIAGSGCNVESFELTHACW